MTTPAVNPGLLEPGPETPAPSLSGYRATGTAVFAGIAVLLAAAHRVFFGPGYAGATLTAILYTIIAVSLSPILFYTLTRPIGPAELRFIATYGAIFSATAPTFYAPSLTGTGMVLSAGFVLLAILPPWIQQLRLRTQMRQLETSNPSHLIDALSAPEASIRTAARARLLELGDESITALLKAWRRLRAEDLRKRDEVLELLVQLSRPAPDETGPTGTLAELAAFWREQVSSARDLETLRRAIQGLGRIRDPEALNPLLSLLRAEQQKGGALGGARDLVCDALFEALAALAEGVLKPGVGGAAGIKNSRELVASLLKFYLAYPGPARFTALASLGAPLVAAIAAQLPEASVAVRRELTRVLSAVRALAAIPPLLDLTQDPAPEVRQAAARGLLELVPAPGEPLEPGHAPLPDPLRRQIVDACIRQAADGDTRVRNAALEGLSRLGDAQALPILLDFLGSPPLPGEDGALHGLIAANLARTRDPLVLDPLLRLVDAADPTVVAGAARGLGWFKDPRVPPRLKLLLEHPDRSVALSAAIGLAHQGDEAGRALLQQALAGPGPTLRLEVLEALGLIPDPTFPAALEAGIAAPLPGWAVRERAWAMQRLIDLKTPESFGALERLWNDPGLEPSVKAMLQARLMASGLLSPDEPASTAEAPKG